MSLPTKIEYIEMPDSIRNAYQYFTEAPMKKIKDAGYKKDFFSLEDAVNDYVRNYLRKNQGHLTSSSY